ncbi:MAG: hypothetical protein SGILL_002633 [Bacillariaceae sp.]
MKRSATNANLRASIVYSNRMKHEFSSTGKVMTQEDIEKARKYNQYCPSCGKLTHQGIALTKRKITNLQLGVWKGICIKCNSEKIPREVLLEHQQSKRSAMMLATKESNSDSSGESTATGSVPRGDFSEVAAKAFREAQRKVHLKRTTRNKVKESWDLLKNDLEGLGLDFFVQIFKEFPNLKALFPFGDNCKTEMEMRSNPLLKQHAVLAMQMLGQAVMGLSDTQDMIPKLRQLGRKHTLIGVKPEHFDDVYQTLMRVLAKRVGQSKWTKETQEAWETVYQMVISIMKDPSRLIDVEPTEGWPLYHSTACLYLAIATPFRLGGFGGIVRGSLSVYLNILDFIAITICALDAFGEELEVAVRLPGQAVSPRTSLKESKTISTARDMYSKLSFPLRFRMYRFVRRFDFSRWAHWRPLDIAILISYGLEIVFQDLLRLPVMHDRYFVTFWRFVAFSIALTRIAALSRVVHFVRSAELIALKESTLRRDQFQKLQVGKIVATLFYSLHLFGCLFSMVAQLEGLKYLDPSFFTDGVDNFDDGGRIPDFDRWSPFAQRMMPFLVNDANPQTWNAYLHAIYWAFVNVTGIGNQAAAPETSLEIAFSLMVHLVGTAYYVWAVGTIFGMLQERSQSFYKVEEGISSLTEFLESCDIPKNDQDKFLSSYIMKNIITQERNEVRDVPTDRPLVPDAADGLPLHLKMELTLHSRAKALRRRGIKTASADFSFALVETLDKTMTLLPGDYLLEAGKRAPSRVYMVDKGTLEILVNGVSKGVLYPGDVIGKGCLAASPIETKEDERHKTHVDWRSPDGMAIADIRAMAKCQLVVGLDTKPEIIDLQRQYTQDVDRIKKELQPVDDLAAARWDKIRLNHLVKRTFSLPTEAMGGADTTPVPKGDSGERASKKDA